MFLRDRQQRLFFDCKPGPSRLDPEPAPRADLTAAKLQPTRTTKGLIGIESRRSPAATQTAPSRSSRTARTAAPDLMDTRFSPRTRPTMPASVPTNKLPSRAAHRA